jgi:hypothetical protein
MSSPAQRRAIYLAAKETLEKLPAVGDRYYVILRLLHELDPNQIPSKVDGRRMSPEESARRRALRKDR